MSVIPLKADIRQREWHVRYVPEADLQKCLAGSLLFGAAMAERDSQHTGLLSQGTRCTPERSRDGFYASFGF